MKLTFPSSSLALLIGLATGSLAFAATSENTIKFSEPGKPGTVKVTVLHGDVRIQGTNTSEVAVVSESDSKPRPRKNGLRVLTESASYSLTEKDNVVTLDAGADGPTGAPSDFRLTVPHGSHVVVSNSLGGEIVCTDVTGDIEIKARNSQVKLDNVSGAALVETRNGPIQVSLRELREGKPLSLTSNNGPVVIRIPEITKANVRLRTHNGVIETDFDEKTLVTKVESVEARGSKQVLTPEAREAFREAARAGAEAARHAAEVVREAAEAARQGAQGAVGPEHRIPPIPPIPPMPVMPAIPAITGGKLVTGTLNSGGPEISVATMNGDITLLKMGTQVEAKK